MTYGHILKPDVSLGTIDLDTSGVSISNTAPQVVFNAISWKSSSSGSASVSGEGNDLITLAANKKYILQATLSFNFISNNDRKFMWYNESTTSWIGKCGVCYSDYEAYNGVTLERIDESARAIIIVGGSNLDVSLRYSGSTAQTFTVGNRNGSSPWTYIEDYGRIEIWEFNK